MATFTATLGLAADMTLFFVPLNYDFGFTLINGTEAHFFGGDFDVFGNDVQINYKDGVGLAVNGFEPSAGTYASMELTFNNQARGTLSGFSPANFVDVNNNNTYLVLAGNDIVTGGLASDRLFGGYSGTDSYTGGGGDDTFIVAAVSAAPTHTITGAGGSTDKIVVVSNIFTTDTVLDLRSATLVDIDAIELSVGTTAIVNSSQWAPDCPLPLRSRSAHRLVAVRFR